MLCLCSRHLRAASWKLPAGQRAKDGPGWAAAMQKKRERQAGPGPRKLGVSLLSLRSLVIEHLLCA